MAHRFGQSVSNGCVDNKKFRQAARISHGALKLWEETLTRRSLSGRCGERVMRVAQTISDLNSSGAITVDAIAEAFSYRSFDQPEA